ncbi:MAG: hypothetical protein F6K14_13530 [Symploca sp. SIO2C1]|nr:hypothetical protein [Symploca sp. SIO2C1]
MTKVSSLITHYSPERRQEAEGRRQKALRETDLFLILFFDVEFYPAPCVVRRSLLKKALPLLFSPHPSSPYQAA